MAWADTFLRTLKENDVRLVTYVADNVLTPLIDGAAADNYFMSIGATREDEAVGTLAGAYMGGLRGVAMMQTSGFALIANALASLIVPYQIPAVIAVSERGNLGRVQHRPGHGCRTMRPTLDAIAVAHHTLADESDHAFHRRQVDQAGVHDAKPGGVHLLTAAHRRKSGGGRQIEVRNVSAPTIDAPAVKVLNRAELTKRLVAKLARDEAVVAGIGNTNFDLYAAGHRPQNFYMLGSMGLLVRFAFGFVALRPA